MKYVILIPIFNDRESLKLLIDNINAEIKDLNHEISWFKLFISLLIFSIRSFNDSLSL